MGDVRDVADIGDIGDIGDTANFSTYAHVSFLHPHPHPHALKRSVVWVSIFTYSHKKTLNAYNQIALLSGFEPGPFDPELCALTIKTPCFSKA